MRELFGSALQPRPIYAEVAGQRTKTPVGVPLPREEPSAKDSTSRSLSEVGVADYRQPALGEDRATR